MRKGKSVLELVCAPVEVVLNIPMASDFSHFKRLSLKD